MIEPHTSPEDLQRWVDFLDSVEQAVVNMGPDQRIPMIVPPVGSGDIPVELADRARDVLTLLDGAQALVEASLEATWTQAERISRAPRAESPVPSGVFDTFA